MLAAVLMLWHQWSTQGLSAVAVVHPTTMHSTITSRNYSTIFPLTENPIFEAGNWNASGGDFAAVRTVSGVAFGTQTGTKSAPAKYDDSTAILAGRWGPDQFVQIKVHYTGAPTDSDYDEVEIRLRSAISLHSNTGYEINCRVGKPGTWGYIQLGKINGLLGDFTGPFDEKTGTDYSCHNADVITGTAIGTTLRVYINGRLVLEAVDSTYPSGAPGIGFYHEGTQAQNSDFGISSMTASDSVPSRWRGGSPSLEARSRAVLRPIREWLRSLKARVRASVILVKK